jgi:hypothetical protein
MQAKSLYRAGMSTAPSARTKLRRKPARGAYDRATIDAILDEALVAHLGFTHENRPYVIPTLHARIGDTVYFHGSAAGRTIRTLSAGTPACLTVTLLDGLVLARSAAHHSGQLPFSVTAQTPVARASSSATAALSRRRR